MAKGFFAITINTSRVFSAAEEKVKPLSQRETKFSNSFEWTWALLDFKTKIHLYEKLQTLGCHFEQIVFKSILTQKIPHITIHAWNVTFNIQLDRCQHFSWNIFSVHYHLKVFIESYDLSQINFQITFRKVAKNDLTEIKTSEHRFHISALLTSEPWESNCPK